MKKSNQLKPYCTPACSSVHVEISHLMQTSFPGQHNPGQHETGPSGAKQGWFEEDEADGFETSSQRQW